MRRPRAALAFRVALLTVSISACSERAVDPEGPALEVVVAGGDGQYGTAGQELVHPLKVLVREVASLRPVADVGVRWTVISGDAEVLGPDIEITGEDGTAVGTLLLGATLGRIEVEARLDGDPGPSVSLEAFLVGRPELDSVTPSAADVGGTVVLSGRNFSPDPEQNVVLFSGLRGRVSSATATRMEVEVPPCLPTRDVEVDTRLGAVSSAPRTLSVAGAAPPAPASVGEPVDVRDDDPFTCIALSGASGALYLAVVHGSSTVASASYPFELAGVASSDGIVADATPRPAGPGDSRMAPRDAQERFERNVRDLERRHVLERTRAAAPPAGHGPAGAPLRSVPTVGESRSFFVYNGEGTSADGFENVTATARYVGEHVVLFLDDEAPPGGFDDADLAAFAERFDAVVHPTVTSAFGSPSDLDGNGRVAVLFTPVVNELTEPESTSFVGGFFYGRDLLPELDYSNAAEVFYTLVPDPAGAHGDPRSVGDVLQAVPAVLAHEFQHMVHFNERVLERDVGQDALWMLEALAQMAEELVARVYLARGDDASTRLFRDGNRRRARLYLERTDTVSVIVSSGRGTLSERGAGFLFLLYIDAQVGGDVLGRLTRSHRVGVSNVEAEAGRSWSVMLPDWWEAIYRDDGTSASGPRQYPGFDLQGFLGPAALDPRNIGGSDFRSAGALPSSAARYYLIDPPDGGFVSIRLGGSAGGPPAPGGALGLRLVRIF